MNLELIESTLKRRALIILTVIPFTFIAAFQGACILWKSAAWQWKSR